MGKGKDSIPRKLRTDRIIRGGSKEGPGYCLPDSGCQQATEYLGYPSFCLDCPFDECVLRVKVNGAVS